MQYGVNVFTNGRIVMQAMEYPADHRPRRGSISLAQLSALIYAINASKFASGIADAYGPCSDAPFFALAAYQRGTLRFAYGDARSNEAEELRRLADLIDRVVGTGAVP